MGLLYEMVVKKKRSMMQSRPVRQTEQEERETNLWTVESILVHEAEHERKEQNK
ncbi:hypothetical protein [Paenibacillus catalpae]|uniref:hypothetical protein n=1 Tax=Paenibacillus catalpae TaxID=1045775 RepID=UPI0015878B14|nr:hypothetical protein [Paenibacillus catalpae]